MGLGILKEGDTIIEGSVERRTHDDDTINLLGDVLKELKKMNIHLAMITDNEIHDWDIE